MRATAWSRWCPSHLLLYSINGLHSNNKDALSSIASCTLRISLAPFLLQRHELEAGIDDGSNHLHIADAVQSRWQELRHGHSIDLAREALLRIKDVNCKCCILMSNVAALGIFTMRYRSLLCSSSFSLLISLSGILAAISCFFDRSENKKSNR